MLCDDTGFQHQGDGIQGESGNFGAHKITDLRDNTAWPCYT